MNLESNNRESSINLSVSFIKIQPNSAKKNTECLSQNLNDMNFMKKLSQMSKLIIPWR